MSVAEMRAKIKAGVWQAIARSGINLSPLPQEDVDKLVSAVTEGVLREMDEILSQVSGQPSSRPITPVDEEDEDAEVVLWEGRPYLSLNVHYQITNERLRVTEGLLGKDREDVELVRVQDVDRTQNLAERALNIGDIHVRSHDPSNPEVTLHNVANPEEVHEILRRAVIKARKRHNLSYREEM